MSERAGTSKRDRERLVQGAGALLSLRRAADLMPMDDATAKAWLRKRGLVCTVEGREMVVWGRVLEAVYDEGRGAGAHRRKPKKASRTRIAVAAGDGADS